MGHISIWNQAAADVRAEFYVNSKEVHHKVLGANASYEWDLGDAGEVIFSNHLAVFTPIDFHHVDVPKDGPVGVRIHGWNEAIWLGLC